MSPQSLLDKFILLVVYTQPTADFGQGLKTFLYTFSAFMYFFVQPYNKCFIIFCLLLNLQYISNKNIYWLCQFAGWFGIVAIETINYTFFIVGKFQAYVFWYMFISAIIGILCTHLYKNIIRRYHFFQKSTYRNTSPN